MVLALRHTLLESLDKWDQVQESYLDLSSVEHYERLLDSGWFHWYYFASICRKDSTYVENWGKIVVESFSLGIRCDEYFVTVNGDWIRNGRTTGQSVKKVPKSFGLWRWIIRYALHVGGPLRAYYVLDVPPQLTVLLPKLITVVAESFLSCGESCHSKQIIPESLVSRPSGQGERRLWRKRLR